jgi:hypothetical protein
MAASGSHCQRVLERGHISHRSLPTPVDEIARRVERRTYINGGTYGQENADCGPLGIASTPLPVDARGNTWILIVTTVAAVQVAVLRSASAKNNGAGTVTMVGFPLPTPRVCAAPIPGQLLSATLATTSCLIERFFDFLSGELIVVNHRHPSTHKCKPVIYHDLLPQVSLTFAETRVELSTRFGDSPVCQLCSPARTGAYIATSVTSPAYFSGVPQTTSAFGTTQTPKIGGPTLATKISRTTEGSTSSPNVNVSSCEKGPR